MIAELTAVSILTASSITSPDNGLAADAVATWAREDAAGRVSVSLDGDGRCMIDRWGKSGAHYRTACGYWIRGRSIFLRLRTMQGPRPEIEATYDPDRDELRLGGDPGEVLTRRPLDERTE
jgi:hypothetical protein